MPAYFSSSISVLLRIFVYALIIDGILGLKFSSSQMFDYRNFSFHKHFEVSILGELFSGLICACVFSWIEGRHRRALDFISTTYLFYLLISWVQYGFPSTLLWWVIFILSFLISYFVARKISLHYELQDIQIEPLVLDSWK